MLNINYFYVYKELLLTDLKILRDTLRDKLTNLLIWASIMLIVNGYMMPAFGVSENYGAFMLAGLCASAGNFEVFPSVANLVSDFEGDRQILYYMSLPVPSWVVWLRYLSYYTIGSLIISSFVLPLGQLILWNKFDITQVNFFKFAVILLMTNLFYSSLALLFASFVKNLLKIGNVWMRFLFPMWFLGCFSFSWQVTYKVWPALAYINLLNPFTYIMEGFRVAVLGQSDYLPYWSSLIMLTLFFVLFTWQGIRRLNKRLDLVN